MPQKYFDNDLDAVRESKITLTRSIYWDVYIIFEENIYV